MKDKRIAIFYNLPFGGARRVVEEHVRFFSQKNSVDIYRLRLDRKKVDIYGLGEEDESHLDTMASRIFEYEDPRIDPKILRWHANFPWVRDFFRLLDLPPYYRLSRRMAADIDAGDYDYVFLHNCAFTTTPLIALFLRSPTVAYLQEFNRQLYEAPPYIRGHRLRDYRLNFPRRLCTRQLKVWDRIMMTRLTVLICNSRHSREGFFRIFGIAPDVCYPGYDPVVYWPSEGQRENLVLSVGALWGHKGHDLAVDVIGLIEETHRPRIAFCFKRGSQGTQNGLEKRAKGLGVMAEFHQGASDDEVASFYRRSKATIYLPLMEPFGLVPLESMACGTPVIGANEGGIRETVHDGETGFLVDRRPEAAAQALKQVLLNPSLAEQMGKAGAQWAASRWTWEHSLENFSEMVVKKLADKFS